MAVCANIKDADFYPPQELQDKAIGLWERDDILEFAEYISLQMSTWTAFSNETHTYNLRCGLNIVSRALPNNTFTIIDRVSKEILFEDPVFTNKFDYYGDHPFPSLKTFKNIPLPPKNLQSTPLNFWKITDLLKYRLYLKEQLINTSMYVPKKNGDSSWDIYFDRANQKGIRLRMRGKPAQIAFYKLPDKSALKYQLVFNEEIKRPPQDKKSST